jgi:hypothetical protein
LMKCAARSAQQDAAHQFVVSKKGGWKSVDAT